MIALVRSDGHRVDTKRIGVDIGEDRRRPRVGNCIRCRDESQIGNNYLVAGLQPKRSKRKMQACRAVAHRKGICGPAVTREVCFELIDVFSDR